jgi:glycosyltransferase involved in cell wall biosynthesis
MKITHVISDTNVGGAGVLLYNLLSSTKDFCEVNVVVPKGSAISESLAKAGATVTELPIHKDKSFFPGDVGKFYSYFKKNPSDIVHTHASLSSRLGAALCGTKICISTRHCALPNGQVKKKSQAQIKVYNFCTSITVSTADCATANLVAEGIDKSRIITIKNGVPERKKLDTGVGISLKRSLNIPDDARIVGCCARLETVKGQDLILRAARDVVRLIPKVFFLFVGDGGARLYLERLCARLGISQRVRFVGFIADPEPYQNLFRINVNASRGTETSCLATSECMSLGIPTVASDFGGNKEMIIDGINGLIFKSDNHFSLEEKLLTLLADTELYQKLSQGARKTYECCFSVDRMANEYKKLYTSLYHAAHT